MRLKSLEFYDSDGYERKARSLVFKVSDASNRCRAVTLELTGVQNLFEYLEAENRAKGSLAFRRHEWTSVYSLVSLFSDVVELFERLTNFWGFRAHHSKKILMTVGCLRARLWKPYPGVSASSPSLRMTCLISAS